MEVEVGSKFDEEWWARRVGSAGFHRIHGNGVVNCVTEGRSRIERLAMCEVRSQMWM